MPRQTLAIVFGVVLLAGALIGFLSGALTYESYVEKALDGQTFWQGIASLISAMGVMTAIGIAVYSEFRITKRFKEQVEVQIKLDVRADERQQSEWTKRRAEILASNLQTFEEARQTQKDICNCLQLELDNIAFDLKYLASMAQMSPGELHPIKLDEMIYPVRPLYDNLGTTMASLPPMIFSAISRCQPKYENCLRRYLYWADLQGKQTTNPYGLPEAACHLRKAAIDYCNALGAAETEEFTD